MKFNCVKMKIDELTIQKDFLEEELVVLIKELDDTKLLLSHTEGLFSELKEEYALGNEDIDVIHRSVPFWHIPTGGTSLYHSEVNMLPSGEELVSQDYYVKLVDGELEFVGYDVSLYVSNDTPRGSTISVGSNDQNLSCNKMIIPRIPKGKLIFLNTFSYAVLGNSDMLKLMNNGRIGIWVSYEDYIRTFDAASIESITDCNVGII